MFVFQKNILLVRLGSKLMVELEPMFRPGALYVGMYFRASKYIKHFWLTPFPMLQLRVSFVETRKPGLIRYEGGVTEIFDGEHWIDLQSADGRIVLMQSTGRGDEVDDR